MTSGEEALTLAAEIVSASAKSFHNPDPANLADASSNQ